MPLTLHSAAFVHEGSIPARNTCNGNDLSPALAWSDVPANTCSFVLICDDPDAPDPVAPKMTWVHWLLYNLPPDCTELAEGIRELPKGTREGINDWQRTGYGGPCPPIGCHRYYFKLYALDIMLELPANATKPQLETAMRGHVLEQATLMGTYQRP